MDVPEYVQLLPDRPPPPLGGAPFRAVVIIEAAVRFDWRNLISAWLVESGCLYMMAWGPDCGLWDDSVDWANLAAFDYGDMPDDKFVMTTWHENVPLEDVFLFCACDARHPHVELGRIILVHISAVDRKNALLANFQRASQGD